MNLAGLVPAILDMIPEFRPIHSELVAKGEIGGDLSERKRTLKATSRRPDLVDKWDFEDLDRYTVFRVLFNYTQDQCKLALNGEGDQDLLNRIFRLVEEAASSPDPEVKNITAGAGPR